MGKAPAFQFYIRDWLADPQLRMASHATKGIWIDLLCFLWEAPERGKLTGTRGQLAQIVSATDGDFDKFLEEVTILKFADMIIDEDGFIEIANRRMRRDAEAAESNRQRQQRFREKGGGDPDRWTAIRIPILIRDGYMCAYCGRKADTVDHIIPKVKGGDESPSNLVACCKRCNQKKNNRTPEDAKMTFWKGYDITKLFNNNSLSNAKITPLSSTSTASSPSKKDPSLRKGSQDCPHEKLIEVYHEVLPELPRVKIWSGQRMQHLRTRWREDPERQDLEWWRGFFEIVKASPFLMGEVPGKGGRPPFLANLPWLVRPENFAKVIEGNYLDRRDTRLSEKAQRSLQAGKRWLQGEGGEDG